MPKSHSLEFRRNNAAVARKLGTPVAQIAKDCGISPVVPVERAPQHRYRGRRETWRHRSGVRWAVRTPGNESGCCSEKGDVLRRAGAYSTRDAPVGRDTSCS